MNRSFAINHRPTLVLFCGLPGSGKTTLAKRLEREGRGIRLSTDEWQAALQVDHAQEEFHGLLQDRLYELCSELLDHGQDVILEDGLWFRNERELKRRMANERRARTEMHYFDLSLDQLWHRIAGRNSLAEPGAVPITRDAVERIWGLFERPDESEISYYDAFIVHQSSSRPPC